MAFLMGSYYHKDTLANFKQYKDRTIAQLKEREHTFDAIVVTGLSGAIMGPTVAAELGKRIVILRKDTDTDNHGEEMEGSMHDGDRWIFLDDMIASGETMARVLTRISELSIKKGVLCYYVGNYLYQEGD